MAGAGKYPGGWPRRRRALCHLLPAGCVLACERDDRAAPPGGICLPLPRAVEIHLRPQRRSAPGCGRRLARPHLASPHASTAMPVVSVIVITYQHEQFIAQAVESVLRQQTRFPVEILISEDCSADATRAIVTDLQRRHPDRIQLFLSERNQNDNEVITRAWA